MRFFSRGLAAVLALVCSASSVPASAQSTSDPLSPVYPVSAAQTAALIAAQQPRDTRVLRVQTIEPTVAGSPDPIAAGGSAAIFTGTGAGSVESIQFACIGDNASWQDSTITIAVDGQSYTAPLGIFFLSYGMGDMTPNASVFMTKHLGVTFASTVSTPTTYPLHTNTSATPTGYEANNPQFGGFRKIYIPYKSSLTITYHSASTAQAYIFTQVQWYQGAAPANLYPATRSVFHMYTSPALGSLAAYGTATWLPTVTGPGELESIHFFALGIPAGSEPKYGGLPTWLEGDPTLTVDGTTYQYGGTEDFFGSQFYATGFVPHADEYGFAALGSSISNSNTYTGMYRYFDQYPMRFNSSLGITWANGQANEGAGPPPTIKFTSMVVYYTAS